MATNYKKPDENCNCRKKENCPMEGGKCRKTSVIYEAKIETDINTYIGLS